MDLLTTCFLSDDDDDTDVLLAQVREAFSSSSSDDEDDEIRELAEAIEERRGPQELRPRIEQYVERVVPRYSAEEFKSHFRLYPATFEDVLSMVGPTIFPPNVTVGRKRIPARKQLLLALWHMATPDSYRSVCEKFNVGRATALRTIRRVTQALCDLAPEFIKWPTGDDATSVMEEFERHSAFPRIIGAIDGTHIAIPAPKEDAQSYVNRKGFHSIQVQAVCTHNLLFTSLYAGHVGSVHDQRVFRLSPVNTYLGNPDYFPQDSHLVGDGAYTLHPCLMKPFRENGHLTPRQRNFNFCLSSARISIERAFGMWEARWRSIRDVLAMTRTDEVPKYILATGVLHNVCILRNDLVEYQLRERVAQREHVIINAPGAADKVNQIMFNLPMRAI